MNEVSIPMVEIFETIEGEGTQAGFPTVFVRVFGCNLRCSWCDTPYSYPPEEAETQVSIEEIVREVNRYSSTHICLTGGEPLLFGDRSVRLIQVLSEIGRITDLHIETNGAIDLEPFLSKIESPKVRYIMDFKLPDSGEMERMNLQNLHKLRVQDELKFVIASQRDFHAAKEVIEHHQPAAQVLFSPVWETMQPSDLAALMLKYGLSRVKFSMQIHKIIWDPAARGV